ncbi:MAG: hypothetical protein M1814_002911 [Vezdaea aestivalis]|nr:MAG: hypothetical protein M1814_002911 [Vezdaea aestivalis]
MLYFLTLVSLFLASASAKGVPLVQAPDYVPSACRDLTYTVQVNVPILDLPEPTSLGSTESVLEYFNKIEQVRLANKTRPLSAEYDIRARYCPNTQDSTSYKEYIMILVHGETYTKDYWAGWFPGVDTKNYSFTNESSKFGEATLAIDRPGNGESTHPLDARELQGPVLKEVIIQTIKKLRNKEIIDKTFKHIVYAGHGIGAEIGFQLARDQPKMFEGLFLTGWNQDASAFPRVAYKQKFKPAALVNATRFGNLSQGYLAMSDVGAREYSFYSGLYPYTMPYLDFANQGTLAVGEKIMYLEGQGPIAKEYGGHVLIMSGANDKVACGDDGSFGDCGQAVNSSLMSLKNSFPRASTFGSYVTPSTGHSWVFHYTSAYVFSAISGWWAYQIY